MPTARYNMPLDIDDLGNELNELYNNMMDDDDNMSELSADNGDETVYVKNETDVVDATGLSCPICYNEFKADDVIAMFGCNFMHFMCAECMSQTTTDDACHLCRTPVTSVQVFKCVTFDKGEGTAEDPVVIND